MMILAVESKVDEDRNTKSTIIDTAKFLLNTINHIFIGFVFIYTVWICWKNGFDLIFTWHVFLCVTGFHVLMAESILLLYSGNTWSQLMRAPQKRTSHWVLQIVGGVCIIIGISLEIYWRDINSKAHFTEPHSILGLVALILLLVTMCNGLGALYSVELRKRLKPIYLKLSHHCLGLACFVIGMASLVLGFDKRIFRANSTPEMQITLQVFSVLVVFLSVPGVLKTVFSHLKTLYLR